MANKDKSIGKGKDAKISGKIDVQAYLKEHGYPEVGQFATQKDVQKFNKQLTQEQLDEWVKLEGLSYTPCPTQPAIHRMRACMAVLYKHFPPERKGKPESPYKAYSLEQLVDLAIDRDVAVEPTDDERIMRMRTIMALKQAGVLTDDGKVVAEAK